LILAHPSLPGGAVVDATVGTVDMAPTLVDLFGLPRPVQPLQGRSWAGALLAGQPWPSGPVFASSRALNGRRELSVVDGRWKFTRVEPDGTERLFDLGSDPAERDDRAARLRQELLDWRAPQRRAWAAPSPGLDPETLDRLHELGYLR
jgi:arylsulfatase A-like enzyme